MELTVDGGRADDGRLDGIVGAGVQDQLVDVAVEGVVGQADGQLVDAGEVVVDGGRGPLAEGVGVGVGEAEDARAAGVQPVARARRRVGAGQAGGDGLCGRRVVRGVGRVCGEGV